MPIEKDFKRRIRSRMEKTGESYTAARHQLLRRARAVPAPAAPPLDLAALAGTSEAAVAKATGRSWKEWTSTLDAWGAREKPHREIARHVFSLGVPGWWSQTVTVGYERIRGLRVRGQRRGADGSAHFEATKSRTFSVPIEDLFAAFADARRRRRWLPPGVVLRRATPLKSARLTWTDGAPIDVGFFAKGPAKSSVAITHGKLPDRAATDAVKREWSALFERLAEVLS